MTENNPKYLIIEKELEEFVKQLFLDKKITLDEASKIQNIASRLQSAAYSEGVATVLNDLEKKGKL